MRQRLFDGLKNVNMDDLPESAWTPLGLNTIPDIAYLYRRVAWLYRAVNVRAMALSSVPFVIVNERGDEVDNTVNWQNTLGYMPNPKAFLSMAEMALCLFGVSYWYKNMNAAGVVKELKYWQPSTVAVNVDWTQGKITGYTRSTGVNQKTYAPEQVLHIALADPFFELDVDGERGSPALAAASASGVLRALDAYVEDYFKRGAIKATIITTKGVMAEERKRIKAWWTDVVSGIKNAFGAHIFEADTITPNVIGSGLDELQNNDLTAQQRQSVCAALGVPESKLWSSAANYATADADNLSFYRETVIPDIELICSAANVQLLPADWRMVPQPEQMDIFQKAESDRSDSLQNLVNVSIPVLTAMDILGYDLTDDQRAAIEEAIEPEEPEEETPTETVQTPIPPAEEPEEEDFEMDEMRRIELQKMQRVAEKHIGEDFDFTSEILPMKEVDEIKTELKACNDIIGIRRVFMLRRNEAKSTRELIDALRAVIRQEGAQYDNP